MICDNDDKYGVHFERTVAGDGIELIHTTPYAPKANALCERFIGSVRRECLNQRIPEPTNVISPPERKPRKVMTLPVLGGLHHDYRWAA